MLVGIRISFEAVFHYDNNYIRHLINTITRVLSVLKMW